MFNFSNICQFLPTFEKANGTLSKGEYEKAGVKSNEVHLREGVARRRLGGQGLPEALVVKPMPGLEVRYPVEQRDRSNTKL